MNRTTEDGSGAGANAKPPCGSLNPVAKVERTPVGLIYVGQVVFSGREQLVLVRPVGGLLTMSMLSYQDEIRKPEDFHGEFARPRTTPRKIKLPENLIRNWTDKDFDFGEYHDRYRQKVKKLVDAKVQGRDVIAPEEEDEPEVVNLMDALKRSVAQRKGSPPRDAKAHATRKDHKTNGSRKRRA